jgi:hypothetical protein
MDDDRMDFHFAVQEIEHRLGLSRGAAQAKLRELCASGVVRSWKRPYEIVENYALPVGEPERVLPSEWKSREVDLATDADGYKNFVDVSKLDLEQQIGKGQESPPRDAEIMRQLRKDRQPGKDIAWKAFCGIIREACNSGHGERGFSDERIRHRTKELQKKIGQIG